MVIEKFSVYREELKINGIAYLCDAINDKKVPTIVMSHGFQCNYMGFEYYSKRFCEYGFAVFCYNFCGGSSRDDFEGKSDGDSRDMCISSEIADLCTVLEYVKEKEYVDKDNIYLLGESQGALVSGLTAAKLKDEIKKLIMIFPAVCIPDHARRGMLGGGKYDPKNPPEEMVLPLTTIGKAFHNDVVDMDVYSLLSEYNGEVLLIQGTDDDIVVPQYQYLVKQIFDATDEAMGYSGEDSVTGLTNHRCSLQMVRDMGHMSHPDYIEGLFASMRQFVRGKKEILTFRIIVTALKDLDETMKESSDGSKELNFHYQDVYFTGYCESELFSGTIARGVDHQIYCGDECIQMLAEYTFEGVDRDGHYAKLEVVNKLDGNQDGVFYDWKPEIRTDCESLKWLNNLNLTAVVENGRLGPTIRIYK